MGIKDLLGFGTAETLEDRQARASQILEEASSAGVSDLMGLLDSYIALSECTDGVDPNKAYDLAGDKIVREVRKTHPDSFTARTYKSRVRIIAPAEVGINLAQTGTVAAMKEFGDGTFSLERAIEAAQRKVDVAKGQLKTQYHGVFSRTVQAATSKVKNLSMPYASLVDDHEANVELYLHLFDDEEREPSTRVNAIQRVGQGIVTGKAVVPVSLPVYDALLKNSALVTQLFSRERAQQETGQATLRFASDEFARRIELLSDEDALTRVYGGSARQISSAVTQLKGLFASNKGYLEEQVGEIHDTHYDAIGESTTFEGKYEAFKSLLSLTLSHSRILEFFDEETRKPRLDSMVSYGAAQLGEVGAEVKWVGAGIRDEFTQKLVVEYDGSQYDTGIIQKKELPKREDKSIVRL